ncbi:hypothetical protein CBR_g8307 [Chara braunii]|uniref:GB1/RHD3-type G domain-containing protein n=1 Tax=Chara braunii TaxID=69332 RepID=A0A388KLT4_CHABU|nr:hypothetical protein CBR_g8307 [Chara braunii]|eukprot:GBG71009.1 hypothetical protein CBR_g8307 [Chara braunii]
MRTSNVITQRRPNARRPLDAFLRGGGLRVGENAWAGGLTQQTDVNKNSFNLHRSFPIVLPDPGHTKLALSEEGLDVISQIDLPVAVVAVIGPYRSGKSFLLNQLLSLSCDEGFGVGHKRDTQTKGIWVWGQPIIVDIASQKTAVLFLDTEGFESVGKANAYDDRIFALAAILSSVLIYNLPETVREADIQKLSFAVELAEEFYGRVKGRQSRFQLGKLLWLIQRDFLEGKTVQEMVDQALLPVPNLSNDREIERVNQIRQSLSLLAKNNTAFGLRQPHLKRTKLCEMTDSDLDPQYVQQRDELKKLVQSIISPKIVSGNQLNGKEFVALLKQTIEALNTGDIPTVGSIMDVFNREIVDRCADMYSKWMEGVRLPVLDSRLEEEHNRALEVVRRKFEAERFGRKSGERAQSTLDSTISTIYSHIRETNLHKSSRQCEQLYMTCEDAIDSLQNMRLPSTGKFDDEFGKCNRTYQELCFGPSMKFYQDRLFKMWSKERSQFLKSYNERLFNWIIVLSLVMVVTSRFVLRSTVLEMVFWSLFVFLEAYTRIFMSVQELYYNAAWRAFVTVWELIVYNAALDLNRWFVPLVWFVVVLLAACKFVRTRRRRIGMALPAASSILRAKQSFRSPRLEVSKRK